MAHFIKKPIILPIKLSIKKNMRAISMIIIH